MTSSRRRRPVTFLASAALLFSGAGQGEPVDAGDRPKGAAPPGEIGTVQTLAGPQFCRGKSKLDPDTETVRSLAVTADEQIYFDTGKPNKGHIARVGPIGQASLISAGLPAPMPPRRPGQANASKGPLGSRMASDGNSGIFVATATKIVHVARGLSTIAGDNPPEAGAREEPDTGLAGPARDARFNQIMSIASDGGAGLYVADRAGPKGSRVRIRFINTRTQTASFYSGIHQISVPPGHIATVAGTGQQGEALRAPPALQARIEGTPPALAASGPLLYIASHTGSSSSAPAGRTRPRPQAEALAAPSPDRTRSKRHAEFKLELFNAGDRVISAHGIAVEPGGVETLAEGPPGYSGDGGPAASARFSYITAMALDGKGNLYVADQLNHRIRKVDGGGRVTTFAGNGPTGPGKGGFDGNGVAASDARLNHPFDVKTGSGGRVWISDLFNRQIRVVDDSGVIQAAPGMGVARDVACLSDGRTPKQTGTGGWDDPVAGAPFGVLSTTKEDVFFTNRVGGQVKRIFAPGMVDTAAGTGTSVPVCGVVKACPVTEGGAAVRARLKGPSRLALARSGLYILDAGDFRIRFVNLSNRTVSRHGVETKPGRIMTVGGNGILGSTGDGGKATGARIDPDQADIAADSRGNLYLSDPTNGKLRVIDAAGQIRRLIGPGRPVPGSGCCSNPQGLTVDAGGGLYISETVPPRVWFWNRGPRPVVVHGQKVQSKAAEPVAGSGATGFEGDGGPATQAALTDPVGLAVDRRRNLYIADRAGNSVRRIDGGGRITTVAGTGQGGFNGDGLRGPLTWLSEPNAVAVDRCGNLLISDSGNGRVRRLILSASCDRTAGAAPGRSGKQAFSVPLVLSLSAVAVAAFLAGAWRIKFVRDRNATPSPPPPT